MRITDLKQTKAGRVSVFIDGGFVSSIDATTFFEYGLRVNDEIDEERLNEMLSLSKRRKANGKAIDLLSYRDHSAFELKRKLLRTNGEEDADAAVERMKELGMVDDKQFAARYADELSNARLYGGMKVKQELIKKGLSREDVDAAMSTLPDQRELIRTLIEGKFSQYNTAESRDKLIRKLLSRGFAWDDVRAVVNDAE